MERLNLSKKDTLLAEEISLKSANIAGITAAQSAEAFAALYSSYNLTVAQLNSVFNQMNAIAVRFNAADKESSRACRGWRAWRILRDWKSARRWAGREITGRTGRPGAESGNALKRLLTNLAKPQMQDDLQADFGINLKDDKGELKKAVRFLTRSTRNMSSSTARNSRNFDQGCRGATDVENCGADGRVCACAHAGGRGIAGLQRAEVEAHLRRDTLQKDLQRWRSIGRSFGFRWGTMAG